MKSQEMIELIRSADQELPFFTWKPSYSYEVGSIHAIYDREIREVVDVPAILTTDGNVLNILTSYQNITLNDEESLRRNDDGTLEKFTPRFIWRSVSRDYWNALESVSDVLESISGHGSVWIDGKEVKLLDSTGGSEGGEEYMDVVFEYDGTMFRVHGYYSSWDENEWFLDELEEVVPKEVTVTQYVSANEKGL